LKYTQDEDLVIKRMVLYCTEIIMKTGIPNISRISQKDKSAKYWHRHYLDTSDKPRNGFYDVGRSEKPFPSLEDLKIQRPQSRECILFDLRDDKSLIAFLEEGSHNNFFVFF
jgi:hypothetical protein